MNRTLLYWRDRVAIAIIRAVAWSMRRALRNERPREAAGRCYAVIDDERNVCMLALGHTGAHSRWVAPWVARVEFDPKLTPPYEPPHHISKGKPS